LYLAAEQQLAKIGGRHIIILLTDGIDTATHQRASFTDALSAVRRAEASVYVLSLTQEIRALIEKESGGKLARLFNGADASAMRRYLYMLDASERQLDELARQTGGRMFLPQKETDLCAAYNAIALELRTQYIITYKPKPRAAAGEYRRIRVLVSPGGYEVGAREGYTGRA
jgi:VWFA-related protein